MSRLPSYLVSSAVLLGIAGFGSSLLFFGWSCDGQTEVEVIDAGCVFPDTGTTSPDGGPDAAAPDGEGSEIGDSQVGGVGDSCGKDADCRSGECESFPSGEFCTENCSPMDNPCPTRDFQCYEDRCVPKSYCDDADRDGYGDGPGCVDADCDDTAPEVHSDHEEVCDNQIDDDCDGDTDEGSEQVFYRDSDGDGWGISKELIQQVSCSPPEGYADAAGDCDDSDPEVHPGREERCNELDDDCDDQMDENCDP